MHKTARQYSFISLEEYEKEAIDFLRKHEPQEGYYVGFSGGKDSITTLKLCQLAGVKHTAYYSCTGIDEPSVVKFIRKEYPSVIWLKPKIDFWHLIIKNWVPLCMRRWCCDALKKNPAKDIPLKMRVMGIRAEESTKRASRPRIYTFNKMTHVKPIFYWKEWQVWEFIEKHKLPYPSLYDEDQTRLGCVICPYILGESEKAQLYLKKRKEKYKGMFAKFERCVYEWWSSKSDWRVKNPSQSFAEFMDLYYRGFPQKPYNDEKQLTLFDKEK